MRQKKREANKENVMDAMMLPESILVLQKKDIDLD